MAKLMNGKPVNEANVRELINIGGNGMPAYADQLSDQDKNDLIAYLKTSVARPVVSEAPCYISFCKAPFRKVPIV